MSLYDLYPWALFVVLVVWPGVSYLKDLWYWLKGGAK